MKLLLLIALVSLLAIPAYVHSDEFVREEALRSVVSLNLQRANGEFDRICTATITGPHEITTAGHCVWSVTRAKVPQAIYISEAHIWSKEDTIREDDGDIAIITTKHRWDHVAQWDKGGPEVGEKIFHWGHTYGFPVHYKEGVMSGWHYATDPEEKMTLVENGLYNLQNKLHWWVQLAVMEGDSGSAVWNEDGKIVCVVSYRPMPGMTGCVVPMFNKDKKDGP